jgi:hypothetical protein
MMIVMIMMMVMAVVIPWPGCDGPRRSREEVAGGLAHGMLSEHGFRVKKRCQIGGGKGKPEE